MIIYLANRRMDILGQASTTLPDGFKIKEDLKTEDIESGVATFSCRIGYDAATRLALEEMTEAGNYLLRSNDSENEFYTIIETEIDTRNQDIYIYAEDAGLDLLNEIAGEFEAEASYNAEWYINKYIKDSGFEIGINEIPSSSTRKLTWDSEETVTSRLASIATQFGGYEIAFSFDIDGLIITNKYINIYKERGKSVGEHLRLNRDIDRIVTTKSVAKLATAFVCEGGVPDNEENPITLKGYAYDDGNFYVGNDGILRSRKAVEKWSRYVWNKEPNLLSGYAGHIVRPYSYDTTSQATLCSHAITELKKICDMEVNYEIDINKLPENIKIGDRVDIVDDAGELYVSTRVLKLESSVVDKKYTATLGENIIKSSGISQKVADLAAQFAKSTVSVKRAQQIANNAAEIATNAKAQAESAATEATNANAVANEAKTAADTATESAAAAQSAANGAQAAVGRVEENINALEETVTQAENAANNAHTAAQTAETLAEEAKAAALKAQEDAVTAATAAENAQTTANNAITKAETAEGTAEIAKTTAESAAATAQGAKADAAQAEADIAALGERLTTVSNTMQADYARKTDLTEATANLQTQITQNAAEITSTASKIQTIDETANDAAEQAAAAQAAAALAQSQADTATADAQAAQNKADEAAAAANAAQAEADTAKEAAATAQGVADKAEADLETAKADLATVSSRVDATEADITAAQNAVNTAQAAADKAKADADTAAQKAVEAQNTANTAVTNAATAQEAANDAANKADIAQQTANEAKGDASAAQAAADEAAAKAVAAQETANTAKTNAETAQAKANEAAQAAVNAQAAADEADTKAAQAAADLATAQQNLADVTSRVDATEEEVAAAQAAVETAQAAADEAKQDAATAQITADTAKANAATAQTAADNAKTAADNAQAAADAAQSAADKAQADVNALVVRVSKAETDIVQNNEKIELRATKTEVTQAVNNIEVGGRNLLRFTAKLPLDYSGNAGIASWARSGLTETEEGLRMDAGETVTSHSFWVPLVYKGAVKNNEEVTLSFDYKGNITRFGSLYFVRATNRTFSLVPDWDLEASETEWQHFKKTFSTENAPSEDCVSILLFYGHTTTTGNGTWVEIKKGSLKLEKGNKATGWTPAPEDVAEDITLAQDTANGAVFEISVHESKINQLAESIAMLVTDENGASLMTQTKDGWTFSTTQIQNAVNDVSLSLSELIKKYGSIEAAIEVLNKAVTDIGAKSEYVNIHPYTYTENGEEKTEPCIELGESDSEFKLLITNTQILFKEGGNLPTRINTDGLITENITIEHELRQTHEEVSGHWHWAVRKNGNYGLQWKEGIK